MKDEYDRSKSRAKFDEETGHDPTLLNIEMCLVRNKKLTVVVAPKPQTKQVQIGLRGSEGINKQRTGGSGQSRPVVVLQSSKWDFPSPQFLASHLSYWRVSCCDRSNGDYNET